jgi:hypothetical protein
MDEKLLNTREDFETYYPVAVGIMKSTASAWRSESPATVGWARSVLREVVAEPSRFPVVRCEEARALLLQDDAEQTRPPGPGRGGEA